VPSEKNEKISRLPDPVLIVGGVPDGQTTVVQVTVRELVSCVRINIKLLPATAVGIVIVALPPEIVNACTVPLAKLIVTDVPAVFVKNVST
jgi:hypothetical protein